MTIAFGVLDDGGSHMTMEHFIDCCKDGGFIDYDGFGYYATETQQSNRTVQPSDVTGKQWSLMRRRQKWYE